MTDRGAWALYGNTKRKMEPMTGAKWATAAAVVPHLDLCTMLLDRTLCRYWGTDEISNTYGFQKKQEADDRTMIRLSIEAMLKNPMQAGALGFLEGCKLLFWEYYTPTAYIVYPRWVQNIYEARPLLLGLRTLLGLLTVLGVIWVCFSVFQRKAGKSFLTNMRDDQFLLKFAMIVWIIAYIIPYSFFFLFGRYALALAPVYLVIIAAMLNSLPSPKRVSNGT